MMNISKNTKLELFNIISQEDDPFAEAKFENGILEILLDIWDLRSMPSQDNPSKSAYDDAFQHIVNNDDWNNEYTFLDRFKLLEDDIAFRNFLETIVKIKYRKDNDEIQKFVLIINSYLEKEKLLLAVTDYDATGNTVYGLREKEKDGFVDLPDNKIPFFVDFSPDGSYNYASGYSYLSSHKKPIEYPAFVLVYNRSWNDYGYITGFTLFYYEDNQSGEDIGTVKITDGESDELEGIMPSQFYILDDKFCSLGQSEQFYENLKSTTGRYFEIVLFALRDVAFFPHIQEKFEKNSVFQNSLLRNFDAERLMREVKYEIYGYDLKNLYRFSYQFTPKYSSDMVEIDFNFNNTGEYSDRIYAIIGKNGTGKTQLVSRLPLDISGKQNELFSPRVPLFSKVIAVSYSSFDTFEIPKKLSHFNYIYCGLLNKDKEPMSRQGLMLRFHHTWKKIKKQQRMKEWRQVLLNFVEEELIDIFIVTEIDEEGISEYNVSLDGFSKIKNKLSSGQSIILFIISEIIANIRFDSLILFDEPETHLHPNAISQLMNTIYDLVHKFESYCIITTHSPIIIQELFSRNVYVIEKHDNFPSIRKIAVESFGQNLSVLTEEVFGNRGVSKHYKKIIDEVVRNYNSYEEVLKILQIDEERPLSLNARLYIESKLNQG